MFHKCVSQNSQRSTGTWVAVRLATLLKKDPSLVFQNQLFVDAQQSRCSCIIHKIQMKTSVLESHSCSQMFFKIVVLKNFENFTANHSVVVFFNKVADPQK